MQPPDNLVSMTTQQTVLLACVFIRVDSDQLGGSRSEGRDNTIARCYGVLVRAAGMRNSETLVWGVVKLCDICYCSELQSVLKVILLKLL